MRPLSSILFDLGIAPAIAAATLVTGCEPVKASQPTEAIVLCGSTCVSGVDPTNTVSKTAGGVATFAWGTEELLPPAADPYGSLHRLTWTASSPTQLLLAFDVDFSAPIVDPSCPLCSQPYAWSFVGLPGTGGPVEKVYSFAKPSDGWSGFTTGHLIRVDRGACRTFITWNLIFEQITQRLDQDVGCAMKCSLGGSATPHQVNRLNVDIQPHFTGLKDDVQHGVLLTATYELEGSLSSSLVTINPVYVFGINPATGRLAVTTLQLGVITFDDAIKTRVEAALSQQLPADLQVLADPQAFSPLPLVPKTKCDKQASLASQQSFCLNKATAVPNMPLALLALHSAIIANGHAEPEATELATLAVSALEPRNFACEGAPGDMKGNCVIRSIYKRLYALPALGLEAVFADTGDDAQIALAKGLGFEGAPPATCGPPASFKDGYISRDMGSAPAMNVAALDCPPCP
jgi:hypothetical protein